MKKVIIQYSIVQFMPYPDREEGVNVGIVSYCPKNADFRFKLLPITKKARVNYFFKELSKDLFKLTMTLVNEELNRLMLMSNQKMMHRCLFDELIRPRESLVRYSDIRVMMTNNLDTCLNDLFNELVAFESKTYKKDHDRILAQKFKGILKQHRVDKFFQETHLEKKDIGLSVTMPFFNESNYKSIKPLSFIEQKDANSLIMHAANWATKIEMLQQAEILDLKEHLVTYERPNNNFEAAFDFALEALDKIDVTLASIDDSKKINQFLDLH